jgi:sterol 3beta-glucosyltransferase
VIPFASDQFFWADRLLKAGVAPVPVPAKGLSADRLARAIDEASKDTMCASAAALAESIAREDGLRVAAAEIQKRIVSGPPTPGRL